MLGKAEDITLNLLLLPLAICWKKERWTQHVVSSERCVFIVIRDRDELPGKWGQGQMALGFLTGQ